MSLSPTDNSPPSTIIPSTAIGSSDGGSRNIITVDTDKLIDALDVLPEAMMKLEKLQRSRNDDKADDDLEVPSSVSPPTSRRFSCHGGVNNSFGMDGLLAQDPEESMAFKARRIMGTLARSRPKEVPRPIEDTASTVLKKLSRYV